MNKERKSRKLIDSRKLGLILGLVFVLAAIILSQWVEVRNTSFTGTYLEFKQDADNGVVDYIRFNGAGQTVDVFLVNNSAYSFWTPRNAEFYEFITDRNIEVKIRRKTLLDAVQTVGITLPFVILAGLIGFVLISMVGSYVVQSVGVNIDKKVTVKFSDIGGLTSVKRDLKYIIEMMNEKPRPDMKLPRGILLYGPPGTGKTLIAKAIAGECNAGFIALTASDFTNMYMGVGAAKVRQVYRVACENSPTVIFIDELDSIAMKRVVADNTAGRETNSTLNTLLAVMDGVQGKENRVLFVAATNMLHGLDEAILRPGRMDRQIYIGVPETLKDTIEIVDIHLSGKTLSNLDELPKIYELFRHMSGAGIESILNDAVLESGREGEHGKINFEYIRRAVIRSVTKSVDTDHISEESRHRTAIHEIGHTLIGLELGYKLLYTTITPQNSGLGGLTSFSDLTTNMRTFTSMQEVLAILMAGSVCEEVIFGDASTLCLNDKDLIEAICSEMRKTGFAENTDLVKKDIEVGLRDFLKENQEKIRQYSEKLEITSVLYEQDFSNYGV